MSPVRAINTSINILALYSFVPEDFQRWHCSLETCSSLIPLVNYSLWSVFYWVHLLVNIVNAVMQELSI